jgi:hypothetical protein
MIHFSREQVQLRFPSTMIRNSNDKIYALVHCRRPHDMSDLLFNIHTYYLHKTISAVNLILKNAVYQKYDKR